MVGLPRVPFLIVFPPRQSKAHHDESCPHIQQDDESYDPQSATYFNRFTTIVAAIVTFACTSLYVIMAVKGRTRATELFCAYALQIAGLFLLLGVTSWFSYRDATWAVTYVDMDENCNSGCAVAFVDGTFCLALGFVMGKMVMKKDSTAYTSNCCIW